MRLDTIAKNYLRKWPTATSTLWQPAQEGGVWLQAQPVDGAGTHPRLRIPGALGGKTQPDGLWLSIVPQTDDNPDGYCDIIAIEVSASRNNLADKRSRYMSSGVARVVELPVAWLTGTVRVQGYGGPERTRWEVSRAFNRQPKATRFLPVRHLRVLYAVPDPLYVSLAQTALEAHEFIAPVRVLNQITAGTTRKFLRRLDPTLAKWHWDHNGGVG